MAEAHRRKKNPQLVRSQLVECAVALAVDQGLQAIGIDAVAAAAGVTKGGFFHHFPSKQDLVDAVFQHLLEGIEKDLEARMDTDATAWGRFTRAYICMTMDARTQDAAKFSTWLTAVADTRLRQVWGEWFKAKLALYGDAEAGPRLETVRFAADGIWLGLLVGVEPVDRPALLGSLLAMTKEGTDA